MGPPPRSFAADAHDCIMVAILADRPNTSLWRELRAQWRAPLGSSLTAAGCRCARDPSRASRFAMAVRPPLTATARSCDVPSRSGRRDVADRTKRWETQECDLMWLDSHRPIQVLWHLSAVDASRHDRSVSKADIRVKPQWQRATSRFTSRRRRYFGGGCLPKPTGEGPGPKKRAGKQRVDRQRICPHFH